MRRRGALTLLPILLLAADSLVYGDIAVTRRGLTQVAAAIAGCPVPYCAAGACYTSHGYRCSQCAAGYVLSRNGRVCACPPGRYATAAGCNECPPNSYCPYRSAPTRCPQNLVTVSTGAPSISSCVNPPGHRYTYSRGRPSAVPCGPNEYSVGLQRQTSCTPCPPGTSTDPGNVVGAHTNSSVCLASPGLYTTSEGVAVPCPIGTYAPARSGLSAQGVSDACSPCSAAGRGNFTTAAVGATSPNDCIYLPPGYTAAIKDITQLAPVSASTPVSSITSKLCPHDHWCPGGLPSDEGYAHACPGGLRTESAGATSEQQCVAPPGYKYVSGLAVECENGYYKGSWDRSSSCTPCGANPATSEDPADDTTGWKSERLVNVPLRDPNNGLVRTSVFVRGNSSTCYIAPGLGALMLDGQLKAVACTNNMYSAGAGRQYGINLRMCNSCPPNQVTACPDGDAVCSADLAASAVTYAGGVVAYLSLRACRHPAGFGWVKTAWASTAFGALDSSAVTSKACPIGWWSQGGHNGTCTACAFGFMTAAEGSTSQEDCVAPPGFKYVSSTVSPVECSDGTYKVGFNKVTACTPCGTSAVPNGWRSAQNFPLMRPNPTTGIPSMTRVRGSVDSCYILAGLGAIQNPAAQPVAGPDGKVQYDLVAVACTNDSYSSEPYRFAASPKPCSTCAAGCQVISCSDVTVPAVKALCEADLVKYTSPATGGYTSAEVCKYKPGYGTVDGAPAICPIGSWSPGGHRTTCTACPGSVSPLNFHQSLGMTTEADCSSCKYGMVYSASSCLLPAGKAAAAQGVCPTGCMAPVNVINITSILDCPINYYCPGGDPTAAGIPQACPTGLYTTSTGSTSSTQCLVPAGKAAVSSCTGTACPTATDVKVVTGTVDCPIGSWCAGGDVTAAGIPHACPTGLSTMAAGATSITACVLAPGSAAVAPSCGGGACLVAVSIASVTGSTSCPLGYYCLGGDPATTGVPQACYTGTTTWVLGGQSADDCTNPDTASLHGFAVSVVPGKRGQSSSSDPWTSAQGSLGMWSSPKAWKQADNIYAANIAVDVAGRFYVAPAALDNLFWFGETDNKKTYITGLTKTWIALAVSNDGNTIAAVAQENTNTVWLATTTNRVTWTWTSLNVGSSTLAWSTIAINGGGSVILAGETGTNAPLYVGQLQAGSNQWLWSSTVTAVGGWESVAVSRTGKRMVAAPAADYLATSYDYGTNWHRITNGPGTGTFLSVACNSACNKMLVAKAGATDPTGSLWIGIDPGLDSWWWSTPSSPTAGHFTAVAASGSFDVLLAVTGTTTSAGQVIRSTSSSNGGGIFTSVAGVTGDWYNLAISG